MSQVSVAVQTIRRLHFVAKLVDEGADRRLKRCATQERFALKILQ
jgi:hypothetical protein